MGPKKNHLTDGCGPCIIAQFPCSPIGATGIKLSKKGIYALRVLRHLVEHYGREQLSAAWLAQTENIPRKYLEQVLSTLRKRGLLVSAYGKHGGYALRVAPDEITLGDIIRAVDGPLAPIPCASRTAPHRCDDCPYPYDTCWLRHLMLRVRDNISDILDRETLAAMVEEVHVATLGHSTVEEDDAK